MESYSSSYSSSNKLAYLTQNPEEAKAQKHAYSFQSHSSLHSVRKSHAKPWKKAPVAPMPPTPVKVYQVDPLNFRELVQHLTGAPEFHPQQPHHQLLQRATRESRDATSLDVASFQRQDLSSKDIAAASRPLHTNQHQGLQSEGMTPMLDMNLSSPSYSNWCSFPLLSPGTMTSLESERVL